MAIDGILSNMTVFSKLKKSDANRKSVALAILLHLLGVVGDSEPPACVQDLYFSNRTIVYMVF